MCCLTVFELQILITPLVSFGHCVVWPSSIYRFWLPLWYLLAIVLSDLLRFTDSEYTFGIFWPFCCLTFFDLQILITPLVSFGHCVVCPSSIYRSWLPLWYLLAIVLSDVLRFTDSDYSFVVFWPLCCLSFFDLQILITSLVSFGHCVVWPSSIYRLWLPLWYHLAIVLSVLLWYTDYDYLFGVFWPLCYLTVFDLQILIPSLVSFGHCVVCPSSIYRFRLHLWYLLAIVLSDLLRFTDYDYIFRPLCCQSFDLQILITSLVPFGHCVVWPSSNYRFWLHLWYLLAIVFSDLLRFTDSDYTFGIFWPLCCLTFFDLQVLITYLVSFCHSVVWPSSIYRFWLPLWYLLAIVLSDLLRFTNHDYHFGIFWSLCCLFVFDILILITSLVSFGHCVVWPSSIYRFWLHLWYLWAILLSVLRFTDSDYLFGTFWPMCCLTVFELQILITPLVSFGHCVVWPSSIYRIWLHLWCLLAIVLSDRLRFTDSDYLFGIFWPLCCLTFFDLQILNIPLVSFGHFVVWPSSIYRFWLHLWYLLAIVLSVLLRFTDSDYTFGIFWPLCCLTVFDLQILITPFGSFGHCVVWSSSIYRIWLLLWCLLAIVLSDLLRFTDYDYIFGPLCCQSFDLQILITSLVPFGHCVVWPSSNYRFWLHLWYLLAIVFLTFFDLQILITPLVSFCHCVVWPLRITDSDYTFGIFWPLCFLTFFDLQILITPLVSFCHCVVWPSSIYRFWLHFWYLFAILLSDLLRFTDSGYLFGIFWPLCCLTFFDLQIMITTLVSFGHCVVCSSLIYWFWLPLWYLLAIVLSDRLRFTDSDYTFGIFRPFCCQSFDLQILITSLVPFGQCVVWPSSNYRFWLHLWYLLAIVLSDRLRFTESDYTFGVFWSLCCLTVFDLQILITSLVSFGHCVVWPSSIYRFWIYLWYLLAILLSDLLRFTDSDYTFGIFWPLCCLSFFDLQILITPLVSFGHCVVWRSSIYRFWLLLCCLLAIVLSVLLRFTDSDYLFGIFWPLCCLTFFDLQIMITSLVSFGDCVVCSSLIYRLWLPLWCLLAIVLSDCLRFTDSDSLFGIFWPLCCLSFFDLQIQITPLVSFDHCVVWPSSIYRFWLLLSDLLAIVLSDLLRFTESDYSFGVFWPLCCLTFFDLQIMITSLGHCVVSPSIYRFWLPLWYLLAIVLSDRLRITDSDYTFGIFWPLCFLTFFELQILITPLVSFGHCVVWPSSIYRFWLHFWYLFAILLSDLLRFTDSGYLFGIFWPLCCLTFFDLQIMITTLVSFGHCVVCSSLIYWFWLPLWYLLAIVLSDLLRFTDSDYTCGILWPLCCMTFFDLQILITSLVSFGHCVVCPSSNYRFWLPLWYLLAIVLSDLLRFTDPDYTFGIFWPLCCLFFFEILIMITSLVFFGHCVVWPSSIYRFWLPLCYLLAIVLSDLLRFTDSDYTVVIFWPLRCLTVFDLQILVTSLVSFGHCVVCSSLRYWFWLPLWYLLAIVLSDLLRFTDYDYLFGIFWPLCCLTFFDLQILNIPLVSFGHFVVWPSSIYRFWLHLWYLLAIVLSVLLRFTDPDYHFGIFWPLCCLTFFDLQILITPLLSFGHCVVCPSSIYRFWLPLWYLLAIVLSDLLRFTDYDYLFGIIWRLCYLFFFDIQIMITSLVSFGHCVIWPSSIYRFWFPLWYLLAIVLSVLLRFTDSDYTFGIFWPLCCLTFFDLQIMITSLGHCVVSPSIYRFWLPLWYLLAIVLSDRLRITDSDYTFGIFWPLCFLTFFDLQILITPLVSFGHCVVWPSSIYRFWLHIWYLFAILLSDLLRFTDSGYLFGIFWPLCCLTFFDLQIMITTLVSFGHCVVCSSLIYWFWLPLWYLLAIVLSDRLRFTDSDYTFGIFGPFCCQSFDLQILITSLVPFGQCVVWPSSNYRFLLHLWYLLAIVLSDRLRFTESDYTFGVFWSLCCLTVFDLQILITSLVSFGHCVVWPSSIYRFWIYLWYLLAILLSDLLRFTDSDYTFGIFWPLCCLSFFDLQIQITPLVSFDHCVVWPSSIYRFWLLLSDLLAIVLSDLLRFTESDYSFGVFWPLCCLTFFDLQIMITSLGHCLSLSVLRFTDSDYLFGTFWPLCCLTVFELQILITPSIYRLWWYLLAIVFSDLFELQILITPLVSFGHCVFWPSSIYRFWLHLWYLLAIVLSDLLRFTGSDYIFGIFLPFCCLTFFDLQILVTSLVSFGHCVVWPSSIYKLWLPLWYLLVIVLSVHLWYTDSDYLFGIFWPLCCLTVFDLQILITPLVSLGHFVVSPSIYRFWLPLWYLLANVLSDRLRITDSDYTFGTFWPLCCLTVFDLQNLITPLVSFGHCVVWPSSIYRFWLPLWYLLAIVLSDLLRFTDSEYTFGIFWPFCCLTFFDLQILITPLVSFGHCVVCPSSIYRSWLPLWYLLAIVLSDVLRFTDSDYSFVVFWPLCCLSFFDLQILITSLVSFGHCVVWPSSIYRLWLPLWYHLAIVLSVLLWYTDYDYLFGVFWPLCYLTVFDLQILIPSLVSFGHCVVCLSSIYRFRLHLWYLLTIVLSDRLRFTDSDYSFRIFWPLCCLIFFDLQNLITPLVSFGHCVVWPSSIYRLWLHLWAIVLSVLRFTDSDYLFGTFWPLCCLTVFELQILITPLVSFGHCVFWPSSNYRFWLHLWYLLAIVLSDLPRFTGSDYIFGIFLPFCCLTFFDLQILVTSLVSFGHCVVWPSSIYKLWLPLWYLLVIVLSVRLWYTDSDYLFGIFWPLCCLTFFDLQILITPVVSFGHCVVWPSSIYRFWLPLWYLLAIVLSVLLRITDSDYLFGIFWPLCCLTFFDLQILITPLVSFGHCVVCSSLRYWLWLPLWYFLAIVLSDLLRFTDSDYLFVIFWPLCCLTFFDLQILITPLLSFGHCVVWPSSIYRFLLPLWYLLAIVLSVLLWDTDSDYHFGIFWPLCCLTFFDLQIMITSLVSFGHCVVWPSSIYRFWLHRWYLLAILLSDRLRITDSGYLFGIFWPLCCLTFFDLQILITPLVTFGHCVVCPSSIYRFWLLLWYLLAIVLSDLLRFTDSDYTFGIFWPLCCLTFFDLQIRITPLVSFGHCVVWPSSIYRFWLLLWYLLAIVLSDLLRFTYSDYLFVIFWPLCCLTFFDLQILITPLVSFGHCVVWPSSIYRLWLPLWYLLAIVLSDLLRFTDSDYSFGVFWPLCCVTFFDLQIMITSLVSFGHCVVSVLLWYTDSDYLFGIFWPLCCLTFDLQILITPLVSLGHCVVSPSIYRFWLPLWYLLAIVLSDRLRITDSDYTFGIFWPLCFLTFFDLQILITPLVSFGHCVVWPSSIYRFSLHFWYLLAILLSDLLRFTDSDYLFGIFWPLCCLTFFDLQVLITFLVSFGHCVVCPSSIYRSWLLLWYLLAIVLSLLLRFTDSDYLFCVFWSLCFLTVLDLQILITPLVSFGHCVLWPSSIYRFWLHLWYLLAIVLSDLLRFTDSDYLFGIFWPLCCLTFFDLQILITSLVSFGHCVVCPSIYRFWLPLWYLLAIVLSDLLRFTDPDYSFCIFWPLCCLSFFDLLILITSLVSFGHCVFWPSSICRFWLHRWYLLAIVLSDLLRFTDSDYTFGIFWPLCCLTFFDLQILITSLVSFGHCVVWPSSIYRFWLPLWYLLAIVLSVLLRFTDYDYLFGIFCRLCCLFFFDILIMITSLVSFGHCVIWPSSIYRFWLPLWYLLAIVLSVLLRFTDPDYSFGIFWPLCCLSFFDLQILITSLVSFGHCVFWPSSIYRFWLHLWYLLAIVLSDLLRFTDSDYTFGIFWPLCCLTFFDLQILITSLVSFGDCVVCSSLIYWLWLPLWCLLAIVLSDRLRFTDSDDLFGIFWPLCCLSFFDLQILITPLVSFGHCVDWPSSIYRFWLHLWYLWAIVLSVLQFTDSDYLFGTFWPLCCLIVFELQILITPLVSFGHCVFWPSSNYRF